MIGPEFFDSVGVPILTFCSICGDAVEISDTDNDGACANCRKGESDD